MAFDGSIRIDTKIDSKGFNSGVKNMGKSIGGITSALLKMAAALGLAFGVGAVLTFGKTAVDAASELSSALLGMQSILESQGKSFSQAQSFIESYTNDGLMDAADAITAYKNLAAADFNSTEIEDMLLRLKDAAAFGRQGSLSLGEAVKSATEGIKNENSVLVDNAGVTKNLSKMWEEYAASIGKSVNNLSQAEKNQATYNGLMNETKHQIGDAEKLSNTFAGQVLALSASFKKLKIAIGDAIIPVVARIIPYVQQAISWLTSLFRIVAQVSQVLFGTNSSASVKGYQSDMESLTNSAQNAADAQGNLANNTEKAGKAAKGALAGFDDLNVLQQDQSGEGTGASNIGSIDIPPLNTEETENSIGGFSERILTIIETLKTKFLEFIEPLREPIDKVKESFGALKDAVSEALQPLFDELGTEGKEILVNAATYFRDLAKDGLEKLAEGLDKLAKWVRANPEAVQAIAVALMAFAAAVILIAVAMGIAAVASAVFGAAMAVVTSPIFLIIVIIGSLITIIVLLVRYWDVLKSAAGIAWEWIKSKWKEAGNWFKEKVTEPVKEGFKTALDSIKEKWEKIFSGIKTFTKNTINSIIDFINGMIRAVASGINSIIGGLNAIKVDIPSWVPGFGGSSWGMNLPIVAAPQIPRLASGAVIPPNAEFAAILGDQRNGRNLEAPEGLIRQIIQEELGNIQAEVSIGFSGSLAALVRELKPYIDKETVRIGGSLVKGGASI